MAPKRSRISQLLDQWQAEHPGEPFVPTFEKEVSDFVSEELRTVPLRKIRSLLAECESLKSALEREFPHLKNVYSPYSDRREDREYNGCVIIIPHLRLEIDQRSTHKKDAEGTVNEGTPARQGFEHSSDYRSVTIHGAKYVLTDRQAQIVQVLHQAYKDGAPDVPIAHILEKIDTPNSRWQDTFKSSPAARKALIKSGERKGFLRLDL